MPVNIVSAKTFRNYVKALAEDLQYWYDLDVISEPFFYELMLQEFTGYIVCNDGADGNATVKDIAEKAYAWYCGLKKNYPNTDFIFDRESLATDENTRQKAIQLRILLRLIKYSCTFIDEKTQAQSVFCIKRPSEVILGDMNLNPKGWKYLSEEQFNAICKYTVGKEKVAMGICPATNFKINNIFGVKVSSFKGFPLLAIDANNYRSMIDELFVHSRLYKEAVKPGEIAFKGMDVSYVGKNVPFTLPPYTENFEALNSKITTFVDSIPDDYEIIILSKFELGKLGYSNELKGFVFKPLSDGGALLNAIFDANSSSLFSEEIAYTGSIPLSLLKCIFNSISTSFIMSTGSPVNYKIAELAGLISGKVTLSQYKPVTPDFTILL